MAEKTEIVENEFGVDVAVRTIRGRACPICRGKIIPSNRAVYLSSGDPTEVFPLWECERCGFSETFQKPDEPKKGHAATPKALASGDKAAGSAAASHTPIAVGKSAQHADGPPTFPTVKRAVPPDVEKMLEVMNRTQTKIEH